MTFRSANWNNIPIVMIHRLNTKLLNRTYSSFAVVLNAGLKMYVLTRNMSSMGQTLLVQEVNLKLSNWVMLPCRPPTKCVTSYKGFHCLLLENIIADYYFLNI